MSLGNARNEVDDPLSNRGGTTGGMAVGCCEQHLLGATERIILDVMFP